MQTNNEKKVVELNLDDVLPNRFQPRIKFDEESINELATSIKKYGVIQPIVVRKIGDKYEIIAGERRYKASVIAGNKTIPAIVYELSDNDSVEIALLENVQREDLTPIEKAISYKKILDMGYINQEDLAQKIGKSQSSVANTLRLLNLAEEAQEALLEKKISERHARSLLKIKDEKNQVMMLNRIIDERLTVRKTDEEIDKMFNGEQQNDAVVNIPDVATPSNNIYDLPGFTNIDNIANNAQDINKEEKPVADLGSLLTPTSNNYQPVEEEIQSGTFFNLFDDNSSNNENNVAEPVLPEFNFGLDSTPAAEPAMSSFSFEQPAVETPAFEAPSTSEAVPTFDASMSFDIPSNDEPLSTFGSSANYNFDAPMSFDIPTGNEPISAQTVEPAMPSFNFEQPAVETPAFEAPSTSATIPTFDASMSFDIPAGNEPISAQTVEPAMSSFNFEQPAVETSTFEAPSTSEAVPTFDASMSFDIPSNDEPLSTFGSSANYNFDAPMSFDIPTGNEPISAQTVEPAMPSFNFEQPAVEAPTFDAPMSFNIPSNDESLPTVDTTMPELNFDEPSLGTPVAPVEVQPEPAKPVEEHRGGLFGLFGKKKENAPVESVSVKAAPTPVVEQTAQTVEPAMPVFDFEQQVSMPELNIDAPMAAQTYDIPVQPAAEASFMPNIRVAIDAIRNCETNLQNMGFIVDVEESDLGGTYQVTIKVNK